MAAACVTSATATVTSSLVYSAVAESSSSSSECKFPQSATWHTRRSTSSFCGGNNVGRRVTLNRKRREKGGIRASGDAEKVNAEEEESLSREFMEYVNKTNATWPGTRQRPAALIPPTGVVRVQMDALMRNDWPEEGSGIRTAFSFSMPNAVTDILSGQGAPPAVSLVRTWEAMERFLSFSQFQAMAQSDAYRPLINCIHWEMASPVTFHGRGDNRSVQAVKVSTGDASAKTERTFTYTFCMEKVTVGAYAGCWMVVGVRCGDYANV